MKIIATVMLTGFVTAMLFTSCSKTHNSNTGGKKTEMLTEIQDTVTGMTGEAALKAKKNTEKKIKEINRKHNKDLEKALRD